MEGRGKKGGSGGSRTKATSLPRDAAARDAASSPRDAAVGTQQPHPSAAPSTQIPLQRLNASLWPEFGVGIHGGQSSSSGTSSGNQWCGYMNLLQQPHFPIGENSHFVGVGKSMIPPSPAPTRPGRVTIDIDDGVEVNRGVKKRFWSHDEEVRLASAWLNTSKDPIHGNDKKIDSFWGQIAEKFNKEAQPDRVRDTNQLKVHWSQLSTRINEFNGYWSSVCKVNKSGYSDDLLMDEAQKMYTKKYKKPFAHVHWWRILKNEPKWCTSVAQAEKDKGKTIEIDDKVEPRPIGREAAKAERKGKRKAEEIIDGIVILGDNINKIVEVAAERKKEREKATEAQMEISRINLKVVKEQKEVKLLQAYNSLLIQDTSNMTDEEKASRAKTLQWMQNKIMAVDEEA
ncbi:unnamed protein product [Urochloa decumbens]|uniref:No apical meristem-associated C-terminal domain-containing protein n=1 Tax=Urochloa decumbens TaxID=240449 RepID=A0ABC9CMN4_9POAL